MSGDWIKMRVGLTTHPRVMRIAECLLESGAFNEWAGLTYSLAGFPPAEPAQAREDRHGALRVTRYVTVTALLRFWGYANEHAKGDAIAGIWPEDVDEVTGVPGFAEAIEAAGWVVFDRKSGGLSMPNFEEHNTSSSERSNAGAERQKRYRERKKQQAENPSVDTVTRDVTRDVTLQEREEKRREEVKPLRVVTDTGAFGQFWEQWPSSPRKVAKSKCAEVWKRRGLDAVADQIVAHLSATKGTEQWQRGYEPAPLTYLNQRRWEDGAGPSADKFAGAM
jgi:hypothetical protein